MNRRSAIRSLMVVGAGSLFCKPSPADAAEQRQDFVIRSEVRLVLLDVSVKDPGGGFVSGLSKENFAVFENGVAQDVTVFAADDVPVTVGILVDESRSMTAKRADVLRAAETFIAESNPRDEVFVLNFNDDVKRGLPDGALFSDDLEQLRSALYRGVPTGMTALNDAIADGLKQLELGRRDKKTLVVISDGGDNASRRTRREMLDMVERNIATIYTIGLFEAGSPDMNPGLLKQVARISGGEAQFPADPEGMVEACRGIAKDIRTRYTIGYLPPARNGGSLRHIRVSVSAPGRARLIARTRDRYRYEQIEESR
ncbi:MAG TPA: VWA domain-containing protein [Candidatus Acidoferrales bacterium]|jgi:Ca-activated chloride channel family protein|nr:VWA domain-containing protein [Candidatus Acidoferrales bacterium]